ncbi:MAG: 4'-phosphopantetheinyl transferase superfamily protein [Thermodesulfobacteriota bacterium]|nr:4'-phosphopantetheinyl transferase superfamily protein [Thermodesulfobacteriota bacterium]
MILCPVISPVSETFKSLPLDRRAAALSRMAKNAAALSAEKSGLVPPVAFQKNDRGAPVAEKGVWWSVSHKPDYVAGVVATFPIGIDVEKILPRSESLIARAVSPAESALFSRDRWTVFFRCWTAKEAALKSRGTGIADLSRCRVVSVLNDTRLLVHFNGTDLPVEQFFFDHHVASVTIPDKCVVAWTVSDCEAMATRSFTL